MVALHADDDVDDLDLLQEIAEVSNPSFKIISVRNGQEVLEFLEASLVIPDIIILDINMPIMDGRACLKFIKKDSRFSNIPVIIFSTSSDQRDVELCHELGAIAYVEKPFNFRDGIDRLSKFFAESK
jgi:CheY-like chemotaxis protein